MAAPPEPVSSATEPVAAPVETCPFHGAGCKMTRQDNGKVNHRVG